MIEQVTPWLIAAPHRRFATASRWLALAASALLFVDTVRLFTWINGAAVVAIPFHASYRVTPLTATVGLVLWAAGMVAVGHPRLRRRWGWLLPVGIAACAMMDRQTHVGSILYLLVVVTAMHAWSERLESQPETSDVRGAPLRVIQALMSIVFLWTALAKLNPRFLSGAVLDISFRGPLDMPDLLVDQTWLVAVSIGAVAFEGALAISLWIDTLRRWAVAGAVVFHVLIVLYFAPTLALTAFALAMGSGYALFAGEPWERTVEGSES